MHNYEQKVLLIHDSASPLPELKHGAFYNDVPTAQTLSELNPKSWTKKKKYEI